MTCVTSDGDAAIAGRVLGPGHGGRRSIGDEVERRAAVHLDRLALEVREHEHRCAVGRLLAPPAPPRPVPLAADGAQHGAPHDGCAVAQDPRDLGGVLLLGLEQPAVQVLAAQPERVLLALVDTRDESVDGHPHIARHPAHPCLLRSLAASSPPPRRASMPALCDAR